MGEPSQLSYEQEVLRVLVYEFRSDDRRETDEKIRKVLGDKELGEYDASRVQILRSLKDDLQTEIRQDVKSQYFVGGYGSYAHVKDFDLEKLTADMSKRHPKVSIDEISEFIPYAIYVYYMR